MNIMKRKIRIHIVTKDLVRANTLIWKADKNIALINIVLQLLQALLPVFSLYVIKQLIDVVAQKSDTFHSIVPVILIFCAIQLVQALIAQYANYINTIHQQKLSDYLSSEVLRKAVEVEYAYYENPAFHDTLHLAQQQSLYKAGQLLSNFNTLLLNSLSLVFLIGFFFTMHSLFALVFVFVSLPLAMIKWYSGYEIIRLERKFAPLEREANYMHQILTGVSYAKEVRVLGFGFSLIEKFKKIRSHIHDRKMKLHVKLTWYSILAEIAEVIAMTLIFFLLAKNAWEKTITISVFVIYIQGFQRLQSISKTFFQSLVQLFQQRIFLQDLFSFFDMESSNSSHGQSVLSDKIEQGIVLKDISFSYPNSNRQVLRQVSLQCKPGQIIAIVGENGSGKSTLVKLLAQLYPMQEGTMQLERVEMATININAFRQNSIFLFQDFEKYFFTVAENISLGEEEKDDDKIKKAAQLSGADSFIKNLSKGYETRMGSIFQGSEQLSGGQWQRLALARIFYKKTKLIVLDEPTSALDATAELSLYQNLKEHLDQKMVVLISHRLYNLKLADYIYVMHQGEIVQEGIFDELILREGNFKKMYEAQKL